MNLLFCVPGRQFSNDFLFCFDRLKDWAYSQGHILTLNNKYTSNVYQVRNMLTGGYNVKKGCHEPFDGPGYEFALFCNSDMFFHPYDVDNMLELMQKYNLDILSGACPVNHCSIAAVLKDPENNWSPLGDFQFIKLGSLAALPDVVECEYTGAAFLLLREGVLEKIPYPQFRPIFYEVLPGYSDFTSEDSGFCILAKQAGFKIWLSTKTKIGHEKTEIII